VLHEASGSAYKFAGAYARTGIKGANSKQRLWQARKRLFTQS